MTGVVEIGARVRMDVDRMSWASSTRNDPAWVDQMRERYRGKVGKVVARSIGGQVLSVVFGDGKVWQGVVQSFTVVT